MSHKSLGNIFLLLFIGLFGFFVGISFPEEILLAKETMQGKIETYSNNTHNVFTSERIKQTDQVTQVETVAGIKQIKADNQLVKIDFFKENPRLVISSINVKGKIVSGDSEAAMKKGFWLFQSPTPFAENANTVIIGHRFYKIPPQKDTFYNLHKVKKGDLIEISTNKTMFTYNVKTITVVSDKNVSVLDQRGKAQLTLITCHPLWTSKQRLVVVADRVSIEHY